MQLSQGYLAFHFAGEKQPCNGRSYLDFCLVGFFLIVFVGEAQNNIDSRKKKTWKLNFHLGTVLNLIIFTYFLWDIFLHPYWQSLQQKTVICVWICRQEGIYFEVLRKKLFHDKFFWGSLHFYLADCRCCHQTKAST